MAIQMSEKSGGRVLELQASGKLTHKDYSYIVPEFERRAKQQAKLRLLFEMVDFHGWDAGGAWDDLKFGLKLSSHVERIAMVGDKKWEKALAALWRPFTKAEVRYFDKARAAEAHAWIESD
jgi:SpoIIAA-like